MCKFCVNMNRVLPDANSMQSSLFVTGNCPLSLLIIFAQTQNLAGGCHYFHLKCFISEVPYWMGELVLLSRAEKNYSLRAWLLSCNSNKAQVPAGIYSAKYPVKLSIILPNACQMCSDKLYFKILINLVYISIILLQATHQVK